ncbi:MAG: hypothetical protein WBB45_00700 [Cyclobacteriaceae bacterium]
MTTSLYDNTDLLIVISISGFILTYAITYLCRSWALVYTSDSYMSVLQRIVRSQILIQTASRIYTQADKKQKSYFEGTVILSELTDTQLVDTYNDLQNKLSVLYYMPDIQDSRAKKYVDELNRIALRSTQASRIIRDCLDRALLKHQGIYSVIEQNFREFAEGDFRFFDIECNQPGRRFATEVEYDVLIIAMLLLAESTFMRTPTSISFYLCYTQNKITLHHLDNDDSESNLNLHVTPREDWPSCYALAASIAESYNGHLLIDPTVTRGLSVEVVFSLPEDHFPA